MQIAKALAAGAALMRLCGPAASSADERRRLWPKSALDSKMSAEKNGVHADVLCRETGRGSTPTGRSHDRRKPCNNTKVLLRETSQRGS
jgi:hypothetical protein